MVDIDLVTEQLRLKGYHVEHVEAVPDNAGEYVFRIDGKEFNLEEARALLEDA